ncbi:hormogonium polysaccharide biosynthesis protein HpsA [Synechococcus sp. PCC 6312]|uniref:hormogonium polysaccharide biosynthesis protein HpsA n=1 Tax=Synechococcus sp. (strain ATCC 27167 / PCC 6312) TaxID=195253 RepID=UPI00029EDBDA|nr:hormogonium polysaccharide biosynthesis protein HpsA [Synechococcus sp. PCC 6312]AFY60663.1 hypothetical protein Syn6312_1499 [Synechococcus sp. PCC 6312]
MSKRNDRFGLSKRTYRKLMGTLRHLFRQLGQWMRRRLKGGQRQNQRGLRLGRARGFVLPTAVLVILVVTITVGALLIRSLNRTTQVSGQRQDLEVVNQATPAIERAKSKLEYLFRVDPRLPQGIPGQDLLREIMRDNPEYTLTGETRIDINGDGTLDNAWYFIPTDDPSSVIAYSITVGRPSDTQLNQTDAQKAAALVTRSRPLRTSAEGAGECSVSTEVGAGLGTGAGWDKITSQVRKNFQIDAFVFTERGGGRALATVETMQERRYEQGNKWGAWFRNDLEIFPGPAFNWNGAMHSEGSVYMGGGSSFSAYLVSAPKSCIYSRDSSEITVPGSLDDSTKFLGQFINGTLRDNNYNGTTVVHSIGAGDGLITSGDANPPAQNVTYTAARDSVNPGGRTAASIALNPVKIITEDVSVSRSSGDLLNQAIKDSAWPTQYYTQYKRLYNDDSDKPYVDDTYRADNRYGPKPVYGKDLNTPDPDLRIPSGSVVGELIPGTNWKLLTDTPYNDPDDAADDNKPKEEIGLDGYWERRARAEGLRLIVGQRLEVGKPLDIPNAWTTGRANEFMQHRALRDNLAAVQGTVLYHYKGVGAVTGAATADSTLSDPIGGSYTNNTTGGYAPMACIASTHHGGTPQTHLRSIRFNEYRGVTGITDTVFPDFLTGRGTDGWEFNPPSINTNMLQALTNLTSFSADRSISGSRYMGAFPPVQEAAGGTVHPNFANITHGDFSNLYRALQLGDISTLSMADQSYIQSAACGVGMLAYNLDILQGPDNTNTTADDFYTTTLGNGTGSQLLNLDSNATASSTDRGVPLLFDGLIASNNPEARASIDASGRPVLTLRRQGISTNLATSSGYSPAERYVSGLVSDWAARPGTTGVIANEQNNTRLARLVAIREQAAYDLNPTSYQCGIPADRPNLRTLFCLGEVGAAGSGNAVGYNATNKATWLPGKFGAVITSATTPVASAFRSTITIAANDSNLNYNYDLAWLDRLAPGDSVFLSGRGVYPFVSWNSATRQLVVDAATTSPILEIGQFGASNTTGGYSGAFAWSSLPTGVTVTPGFTFNYNGAATSYTATSGAVNIPVARINRDLLPSSLQSADTLNQYRVGFRISGTNYIGVVTASPTGSGNLTISDIRNTSGTLSNPTFPNSGTIPIALIEAPSPAGSTSTNRLPLYTFNTARKYTALQPLFNPPGGTAVNPNDIAASPRAIGSWVTPTSTATALTTYNQIVGPAAADQVYNVAFLDNTMFNGREEMAVRTMDINLGMLRGATIGGDTWLPMSGMVYAFREDALREDGIARPAGTWMNAAANPGTDPTLATFGISIKPVDFFADPMRRPHGFRLRNGIRVDRSGIAASKNIRGLTFISDNPAYIQGDFNWHSTNGTNAEGNRIEEFTQKLPTGSLYNVTEFYTNRTTRNTNFARPTTDTWRPTEVLADAVSIISQDFCPGTANDYFAEAYNLTVVNLAANSPENLVTTYPKSGTGTGEVVNNTGTGNRVYLQCNNNTNNLVTSFLNSNRPRGDGTEGTATGGLPVNNVWLREDPFDPSTPVYINSNGLPLQVDYTTGLWNTFTNATGSWWNAFTGSNGRNAGGVQDTRVNAVIISATVASRPGQSYGGMHNFPRFLQGWGNLWISGSFLQLNFSTQATGPFDQDQWESSSGVPALTAYNVAGDEGNERINYYGAPTRRWGYDPGLQLAPAGPVAERFLRKLNSRSVFFNELPANDPYILNLRCASRSGGGRIDPTVTGCPT